MLCSQSFRSGRGPPRSGRTRLAHFWNTLHKILLNNLKESHNNKMKRKLRSIMFPEGSNSDLKSLSTRSWPYETIFGDHYPAPMYRRKVQFGRFFAPMYRRKVGKELILNYLHCCCTSILILTTKFYFLVTF